MTEDEAKTKWCPFARVAGPVASEAEGMSYNRWPGDDGSASAMLDESPTALCIASACMAWRWADEIERRFTGAAPEGDGWQRVEAIGGIAHYARTHKTPHGFCGLAGQP